jgi:hypothetical protein
MGHDVEETPDQWLKREPGEVPRSNDVRCEGSAGGSCLKLGGELIR